MAEHFIIPSADASLVDPISGYCAETKTFHSLRPNVPLPNPSFPLSYPSFAFSLLPSPLPTNPALIDSITGASISYPTFLSQSYSLSHVLKSRYSLTKGDVAFILCPSSLQVPFLYFALLSLGVVISPANPISTPQEISRLLTLVNPKLAFATSSFASKLPNTLKIVLLENLDFESTDSYDNNNETVNVHQMDGAAIQFSSGTTGRVKAALLPHRSFIAMIAGFHALRPSSEKVETTLLVAPMFHSFGFFTTLKGLALGETIVVMTKLGLHDILGAAEKYGATLMTAAPPVVVAMGNNNESNKYDLGRMKRIFCGGAPLSVLAALKFMRRFPHIHLLQGYGSTEAGGISRMLNAEESRHLKSTGKLTENVEAKIIDIVTGNPLPIGRKGELCVRSPAAMLGYVGDEEANASTFDSYGWLKTGDLCYIDNNGYLYVVDRLKELIKYKAYQVPPAELEHLLHSLPDVVDAAVIPFPQEEVGQIPLAFVVRRKGSNINEEQIMEYVAKKVAPYKKIRKVVFVHSIPKSPTGKILRRELMSHAHYDAPMCRL